jgi:hypothetical protein
MRRRVAQKLVLDRRCHCVFSAFSGKKKCGAVEGGFWAFLGYFEGGLGKKWSDVDGFLW